MAWIDRPDLGGLLISYDDYRKLERNIIALRTQITRLEGLIDFYEGKPMK